MSQIQQLNISLEGIGSVLKSRRFKVPAYQRSYAWEVEHVESLLVDIHEAINNKEREYFLGSIVVTSSHEWFQYFDHEEIRTYQNRLGNLAIMSSRKNSILGNESFSEKKSSYSDSSFFFTKIISDDEKWGKEAIEKRQERMADVAVKRWSI